jgi:hypothetical protein
MELGRQVVLPAALTAFQGMSADEFVADLDGADILFVREAERW